MKRLTLLLLLGGCIYNPYTGFWQLGRWAYPYGFGWNGSYFCFHYYAYPSYGYRGGAYPYPVAPVVLAGHGTAPILGR